MEMRELQLFLALAEELHFGRAAAQCHLSPSAATRMLQRLEGELGASLFERDKRKVALTRSGGEFLLYARETVSRWQAIKTRLASYQSQPRGQLRLYCSVTAAYSVLASILPKIRTHYPDIEIHLNTGDQALAMRRVSEGHDDLAIAARSGQLGDALVFHSLLHSPLVCIAPAIPCAVNEQLRATSGRLGSEVPWVLPETGLVRARLERWFRGRQLLPRIYAYVSGHEAIASLVALGFGIGVIPEIVLKNSPLRDQLSLIETGPLLEPFDIGLIARRGRMQDPVVRAVWQLAAGDGLATVDRD